MRTKLPEQGPPYLVELAHLIRFSCEFRLQQLIQHVPEPIMMFRADTLSPRLFGAGARRSISF
ncbi:hypothetical protein AB0B54_30650 [Microbispora bryophytorum]|uniref:hypothetical protein n=1 Tax=Microbispora bryophytorum TaxID=1460882 RepID=UPI0033FE7E83